MQHWFRIISIKFAFAAYAVNYIIIKIHLQMPDRCRRSRVSYVLDKPLSFLLTKKQEVDTWIIPISDMPCTGLCDPLPWPAYVDLSVHVEGAPWQYAYLWRLVIFS